MQEWFASWFDSPYYPILYKHRDYAEAEKFVKKLLVELSLDSGSRVVDLGCGRGRHSKTMAESGLHVTGLDLSPQSISDARELGVANAQFEVHDMRDKIPGNDYDAVFNLFTSFGYFEQMEDNVKVLSNVHGALRPGGVFILDYMNAYKAMKELVAEETQHHDGIEFRIKREVDHGVIVKSIHVIDGGREPRFEERVRGFIAETLELMLQDAGFEVYQIWGDYDGNEFDLNSSPRCVVFARK